jgi:hypothetical protein
MYRLARLQEPDTRIPVFIKSSSESISYYCWPWIYLYEGFSQNTSLIGDRLVGYAKEQIPCILRYQAGDFVVESWSMDTTLMVSAGYENVPVRARRKVFVEVDLNVVRVIKQEKPVFALPRKPNNRVICRFAYPPD